mgnify:CR=1 FL=1|tara:strand:- start:90 stop:305 length:216 start_codon:yes stop_codon:yes gene_type:complete
MKFEPKKKLDSPKPKAKSYANIKGDFKTIIQLKIALRGLAKKELIAFAEKYDVVYSDVSEIADKAKAKYLK